MPVVSCAPCLPAARALLTCVLRALLSCVLVAVHVHVPGLHVCILQDKPLLHGVDVSKSKMFRSQRVRAAAAFAAAAHAGQVRRGRGGGEGTPGSRGTACGTSSSRGSSSARPSAAAAAAAEEEACIHEHSSSTCLWLGQQPAAVVCSAERGHEHTLGGLAYWHGALHVACPLQVVSGWCEGRKDWFYTHIGWWPLETATALASLLHLLVSTCVPPPPAHTHIHPHPPLLPPRLSCRPALQVRKTGEPYVTHCIETALIVESNLPHWRQDSRWVDRQTGGMLEERKRK